jgi:hypothetical protein
LAFLAHSAQDQISKIVVERDIVNVASFLHELCAPFWIVDLGTFPKVRDFVFTGGMGVKQKLELYLPQGLYDAVWHASVFAVDELGSFDLGRSADVRHPGLLHSVFPALVAAHPLLDRRHRVPEILPRGVVRLWPRGTLKLARDEA